MNRLTKKALYIALSLVLSFSCLTVFAKSVDAHPFTDVDESKWYHSAVQNVWKNGFMQGISKSSFGAETQLTRAMFVTVLGRFANADTQDKNSSFSDVSENAWYAPYVLWAVENEITKGTDENHFSPESKVTREQAASFICRFLEKTDYENLENVSTFKDYADISSFSLSSVAFCNDFGIMTGADGSFNPGKTITRAEAAAVITRLHKYLLDEDANIVFSHSSFNEIDSSKLKKAIYAMCNAEFDGASLAKWVYYVAFSQSFTLDGTPHEILDNIFASNDGLDEDALSKKTYLLNMVAPNFYANKKAEIIKENFKGESFIKPSKENLFVGDILVMQENSEIADSAFIYMYDGKKFAQMRQKGVIYQDADEWLEKIAKCDRYVILRPYQVIKNINYSTPVKDTEFTPYQEALITTAESYIIRGDRVQYADTNMCAYGEYRWQQGVKAPEDYTGDEWGYTNCAAFCHDVYYFGLGYEIDMYTTRVLIDAPDEIRPFYYEITGKETDEEKAEIKEKFLNELKPADIIVYRRESGGHAMFYAGNDTIIHSTGSTYKYTEQKERYEASIRYKNLNDLFTEGMSTDLFSGKTIKFAIVRPLNTFEGEIPENSQNRVKNMKGIFAEKLSYYNSGRTVNPGDEISFSFTVLNTNDYDTKIEIKDTVPENTTYISGAEKVSENELSWELTLKAGEEKTVSYTVSVNDDTPFGTYIKSSSTVGGVSVNCAEILVARTLTLEEQAKIAKEIENLKALNLSGVMLAKEIYKNALGKENLIPGKNYEDLTDEVFMLDEAFESPSENLYQLGRYLLNPTGKCAQMVVPALYGGRGLWVEPYGIRTRLPRENKLIVGDIVIGKNINEDGLYIYTHKGLFDLHKKEMVADSKYYLASLMGLDNFDYYFAVIRPSMAIN